MIGATHVAHMYWTLLQVSGFMNQEDLIGDFPNFLHFVANIRVFRVLYH